MYAKIVVSLLIVTFLPCKSQNQRYVEVPFNEDAPLSIRPQRIETNFANHRQHFTPTTLNKPSRQFIGNNQLRIPATHILTTLAPTQQPTNNFVSNHEINFPRNRFSNKNIPQIIEQAPTPELSFNTPPSTLVQNFPEETEEATFSIKARPIQNTRPFIPSFLPRQHSATVQPTFPVSSAKEVRHQVQDRNRAELEEKLFREQAESAKYSFASQIEDGINGNQHQREEVRDGLNVKGMYSYSDGYVRRTVQYEADDKGYRVVKEVEEPLGDGPQFDPHGHADVSSFVSGNAFQYSISAADIQEPKKTLPQLNRSL